jgi:hypothetical protein
LLPTNNAYEAMPLPKASILCNLVEVISGRDVSGAQFRLQFQGNYNFGVSPA